MEKTMSDEPNWLNSNGLVDGSIPAGGACFVADGCKIRTAYCPTKDSPRDVPFSCALVRLMSIMALNKKKRTRNQPRPKGRSTR